MSLYHRLRRTTAGLLLATASASAQDVVDYAVLVSARAVDGPSPRIMLTWNADGNAEGYRIFRRTRTQGFGTTPMVTLATTDTTFVDTTIAAGQAYEYRILKTCSAVVGKDDNNRDIVVRYVAAGYAASGLRITPVVRGRVLVVVDTTLAEALRPSVDTLVADLRAEGWETLVRYGQRADQFSAQAVQATMTMIRDEHRSAPLASVLLVGRLAVPYAGNIAPDGHPDHQGAWPCDGCYGDVDGTFTDATVDQDNASRPSNRNVPGDGKWDASTFPSALEVAVGRVDFHDLPGLGTDEVTLLQRYFSKNHAYRRGLMPVDDRALVDNNFGATAYPEAFASSGYRMFAPFVGHDGVRPGRFLTDLAEPPAARFVYACGGGTDSSAGGVIGGASHFLTSPVHGVFSFMFGSYFGDWDTRDNLLRATVAGSPTILTAGWSGRPHWFLHPMAIGEPMGTALLLSQDHPAPSVGVGQESDYLSHYFLNANGTVSRGATGYRQVHIALMGDPTLRAMTVPTPPQAVSLVATDADTGTGVTLSWTPADEPSVGYFIVRQRGGNPNFVPVNQEALTGTSYTDPIAATGTIRYRLIPATLVEAYGSSFWHAGGYTEVSIVPTSVDDTGDRPVATLRVRPNPSTGPVTFDIDLSAPTDVTVDVDDLTGRTVWSTTALRALPGSQIMQWSGMDATGTPVAPGQYVVRVRTRYGTTTTLVAVIR